MTKTGRFVLLSFLPALALADLGNLPLSFEENRGQADGSYRFLSRGHGYRLLLAPTSAVFEAGGATIRMRVMDANPAARGAGEELLEGTSNYLLGSDPSRWRTGVPNYRRVRFAGVYAGIDLLYYGNRRQLEYDFVVNPGADPDQIMLEFEGTRGAHIRDGELVLETAAGEVRHQRPVIYQEIHGRRSLVPGGYRLLAKNRVGFRVAAYDRNHRLVIDPTLLFATFYGGRLREAATSIAVDLEGNVYVAGLATSPDFPATPGAVQTSVSGAANDVFVVKINATGTAVLYSTLLGGNDEESDVSLAVDAAGNAYVGGTTRSMNFPTTGGAFRIQPLGGADGFAFKLNPTGSLLLYSTRIGGRANDAVRGLAIDRNGNAYVTGETHSANFPVTEDVFQTERKGPSDCFVTKLNTTGSRLVYSTLLGGDLDAQVVAFESCRAIAVDRFGLAHVGGITTLRDFPIVSPSFQAQHLGQGDGFVAKLNEAGTALLYSTFLGGEGNDQVNALTVDPGGNLYAVGATGSVRFPVTPGVFRQFGSGGTSLPSEAFVTKLDANGLAVYSTYLGGSGDEAANSVTADAAGNAYVFGTTNSPDFPTTFDALQVSLANTTGETDDAFLTQLNALGQQPVFSTYLGGTRNEVGAAITRDSTGSLFVAGFTQSRDFPLNPGALQRTTGFGTSTAFIARIGEVNRAPSILVAISPISQSANQDTELPDPLVVELRDQFNNPQRNQTIQFSATNAILSATAANTDAAGRASVRVRLGNRPGTATVTATYGNLAPLRFSFTVIRVGPPLPAINAGGVVGAGLSVPPVRQISVNAIASIFGDFFAPEGIDRRVTANDLVGGMLPTNFAGVCVTVNGVAARLFSVATRQVNFQVPEVNALGAVRVQVIINCGQPGELRSDEETVQMLGASPEFFYLVRNADGRNPVAAIHALTGALIGPPETGGTPARPHDVVTVFGTGFGRTNPQFGSGELPDTPAPTLETPVVTLDGRPLPADHVLYAGVTPGNAGLFQLTLRVPRDSRNGALSLSLRFGTQITPPGGFLPIAGGEDRDPRIAVSPTRLDFGDVIVGQARELPLTIANAGIGPLNVISLSAGPAFTVQPAFGFALDPGEQRLLTVRFAPAATGRVTAALAIRSDDPAAPTVEVPLIANAVPVPAVPNPVPRITGLSPNSAEAGGGGFNLVVNGSGYIPSSVVEWNGQARSTFFNHSGQLIAFITAIDIANPGTVPVTVFNPAPGGGRSEPALITVRADLPLGASVLINQLDLGACPEIISYAAVLDERGLPLGGLGTPTCTDDGLVSPCRLTVPAEPPLSVLIAVSMNGLTGSEDVALLKVALGGFLRSLNPADRVALLHVEQDARPLLGFTDNKDQAIALIDQLRPVGAGNALFDAIGLAVSTIRGETRNRQAVLFITPQGNLSGAFRDVGQVLGTAVAQGSPFFTFAIGPGAGDIALQGMLRQLARDTGAQLVSEANPLNYGRMLETMSQILKRQYQVHHTAPRVDSQPHTLRLTFLTPSGPASGSRTYVCGR